MNDPSPTLSRITPARGSARKLRERLEAFLSRGTRSAIHWGPRASYGLIEQALFSGASFGVHIALARWLAPGEYGGFAVVLAVFMILAGIQNALILEPMSIFGAKKSAVDLRIYLAGLFWPHNGVTAGIVFLTVLSLPLLSLLSVGDAKWALPLSAPLILTYWAARRIYYLKKEPKSALVLSFWYASSLFVGLVVLRFADWLSSFTAFLLLGMAAGFSTFLTVLRKRRSRLLSTPRFIDTSLLLRHWGYGKWALGETFMSSLTGPIYPLLIAYFAGLQQAGSFRAIQNLVTPLMQVVAVLVLLLLPRMASIHATGGNPALARKTVAAVAIFVTITLAYLLPIVASGSWLVRLLYGNSEYYSSLWLLPYFGLAAINTAVAVPLGIALRVAERPDQIFWSRVGSSVITVTIGAYLGMTLGMKGLAIALVMSAFTGAVLLGWFSVPLLRPLSPEPIAHSDYRSHG